MGDLFEKLDLKFNKTTFDKQKDISTIQNKEFNLPLVNAKNGNNGVMYYGRSNDFDSADMTIDIVNDGAISTGNVYSQPQKTGVLYNAYLVNPKFHKNEKLLHFFAATMQKSIKLKFGYENKAGWNKVKNEKIQLPTKNGEINFAFMEKFIAELEAERIAELEAERIAELEAYLVATGLKDYKLTTEEKQVLADFENGKFEWREFNLEKLFTVTSYKQRFDANKVTVTDKGNPYVVRSALNNGIRGCINENEEFLNEGNTISFGQDTATMFYQENSYFTGDKIKIIKSKSSEFNKKNAQFFIASMSKSFSSFSWGSSSFNVNIINNQPLKIPTKNNKPNYAMMETFISAIQKIAIKDVVDYADKKISATKTIVRPLHKYE